MYIDLNMLFSLQYRDLLDIAVLVSQLKLSGLYYLHTLPCSPHLVLFEFIMKFCGKYMYDLVFPHSDFPLACGGILPLSTIRKESFNGGMGICLIFCLCVQVFGTIIFIFLKYNWL